MWKGTTVGPLEIVVLALLGLVPVAAIAFVAAKARGRQVEAFSVAHGLILTPANESLIAAYLDRSWRWRLTGAVLGAVIPFGTRVPGLEMLGGYLVGALAAELTESRLRRGAQPTATLAPRSLADYLSPGILRALRATAVVAVALVPVYLVIPRRVSVTEHPQLLVGSALAMIAAAAVETALRLIVNRPQPAADPDLLAADDAIRSASIHACAGAGLAIMLLLVAIELWALGFGTDMQLLRWVSPFLSIAASLGAFVTWSLFGHDRPWRVQRNNPGQVHP